MKSKNDLSQYDASTRSEQLLNYVLDEGNKTLKQKKEGPKISIKEALKGPSQYEIISARETTRLLFISQDSSLLNQTTQSLDGYLNMSDVFDEVHIVILQPGIRARNPVLRVAPNVWLYIASAKHRFMTPLAAYKTISNQLMFADGFRADMIVARDSFESALVALWAGNKFNRPTQLHILDDIFDAKVRLNKRISFFRYVFGKTLLKKFLSIRTVTDQLTKKITQFYPNIPNVASLPRFLNLDQYIQSDISFDVKERYRQFSFIIVYVGNLNIDSKAYQAIDVARTQMRNKKIGLIIVGEGNAKPEFKKRVEILGIKEQVVFESNTDDLVSYLKTADLLLIPDNTSQGDEISVAAASVGMPIIMSETSFRNDVFENEKSALLFNENDIPTFTNHLSKILSEPNFRDMLAHNAKELVPKLVNDDPLTYKLSYRDSVEQAMFISGK